MKAGVVKVVGGPPVGVQGGIDRNTRIVALVQVRRVVERKVATEGKLGIAGTGGANVHSCHLSFQVLYYNVQYGEMMSL